MKQSTNQLPRNRIDADLHIWNQRQQDYVNSFGSELGKDRDFLKAKYQVLQQIRNKHAGAKLSFDEQISDRILRGQMKQLNRRIYPNKFIRLIVNAARLLINLANVPFQIGQKVAAYYNERSIVPVKDYTFSDKAIPITNQAKTNVNSLRSTNLDNLVATKDYKRDQAGFAQHLTQQKNKLGDTSEKTGSQLRGKESSDVQKNGVQQLVRKSFTRARNVAPVAAGQKVKL